MLPFAERQPQPVVVDAAHRRVRDAGRPRSLVHELALGAQIDTLARFARRSWLPRPPAGLLKGAKLLAGAKVRQPQPPAVQRAADAKRGRRRQHHRDCPRVDRERSSERGCADCARRVEIPRRQS